MAAVVSLAAAVLFVVWRERRASARERTPQSVELTAERRGAEATPEASNVYLDEAQRTRDASKPADVATSPGRESTTAPRSARSCRGRFLFVDGEPAPSVGFVVESRASDDAPYAVVGRGLSKPDGSFSLELFENWRLGRPVRFAASPGERLNLDSVERSLSSDAPLEVAVSGARVTIQVVDSRGAPARDLKLCYRPLASTQASAEPALHFGTTDREGRDYLDFVTPETIVVWAVGADEADCTDRVELAAQHGVRANRVRLTAPGLPLKGGLRVTVVDEFDQPIEQAFVSLYRGREYLPGFKKSDMAFVYEPLAPGEYTLEAQPTRTGAERHDAALPPYLAAQTRVVVSGRVEDLRIALKRAAILVLDVQRTSPLPELSACLCLPEEQESASRAVGAVPWSLRDIVCTRFVDAAGVVRFDTATRRTSFSEPGRYWLHAPPGTFEVMVFQAGEESRYFSRGLVELKSEQETVLAIKF